VQRENRSESGGRGRGVKRSGCGVRERGGFITEGGRDIVFGCGVRERGGFIAEEGRDIVFGCGVWERGGFITEEGRWFHRGRERYCVRVRSVGARRIILMVCEYTNHG